MIIQIKDKGIVLNTRFHVGHDHWVGSHCHAEIGTVYDVRSDRTFDQDVPDPWIWSFLQEKSVVMTKKSKREVLMVFIVNCVSFLGIYTLVRAVLHTLDHLSPKYPYPHSNIFLIRAVP